MKLKKVSKIWKSVFILALVLALSFLLLNYLASERYVIIGWGS